MTSYAFTIAHNLAANWRRHNNVVHQFQLEQNCSVNNTMRSESPAAEYEFRETQRIIIDALANLPHHQRMIFIMSRFQGLTYNQIADHLDISPKTVESHMVKALRLLRQSVETAAC